MTAPGPGPAPGHRSVWQPSFTSLDLRPPEITRGLAWTLCAILTSIAVMICAIWVYYASTKVNLRFRQGAPGEAIVVHGGTLRVEGVQRVAEVTSTDGRDPVPAPPNATFVLVQMEFERSDSDEYQSCRYFLLGPDGQAWSPTSEVYQTRALPNSCEGSAPHAKTRFESIYLVPTALSDRLYGVGEGALKVGEPVVVARPD